MYRILIVSDDAFLRDVIRMALHDMPAEVRCADSAGTMFVRVRQVLFDLVIVLDATPFLCDSDAVRRLRPTGLRRPAIYVVSWQQAEQTVLSLLECGVDQYMTFPLNLHRLRAKVAHELERA